MSISQNKPRVAFQGVRGAFSEEAAIALLGSEVELIARRTFADLFRSLNDHVADFILAPVENSISGTVQASVSLLNQSELQVIDEVAIPVAQHLIACPGATFSQLLTVQSHPVALAQCGRFFAENPQLTRVEADDTAGSVAEIIERADSTRAAIAGRRAAQLYRAVILRENIQDQPENYTRFLLLQTKVGTKTQTQNQLEEGYKS